jgi:hypothetical protein
VKWFQNHTRYSVNTRPVSHELLVVAEARRRAAHERRAGDDCCKDGHCRGDGVGELRRLFSRTQIGEVRTSGELATTAARMATVVKAGLASRSQPAAVDVVLRPEVVPASEGACEPWKQIRRPRTWSSGARAKGSGNR